MENMIKNAQSEIEKIMAGDKNRGDLISLTYLRLTEEAILESLPRIGSSREKEEEIYKWRFASNKAAWHEMCLLQKKAIVLQDKVAEIEKLKNRDAAAYEAKAETLAKLKEERDITKADFYQIAGKYAEIYSQCKMIDSLGFYLDDIKLTPVQIVEFAQGLEKSQAEEFWGRYFALERKLIEKTETAPASGKGTMGE